MMSMYLSISTGKWLVTLQCGVASGRSTRPTRYAKVHSSVMSSCVVAGTSRSCRVGSATDTGAGGGGGGGVHSGGYLHVRAGTGRQ